MQRPGRDRQLGGRWRSGRPPRQPINPLTINLPIPGPKNNDDTAGGIIVADVNQDKKPDFLVTCRGHIAAIDNSGKKLWVKKVDLVVSSQSERNGLPGHHGPGVAAGDVD